MDGKSSRRAGDQNSVQQNCSAANINDILAFRMRSLQRLHSSVGSASCCKMLTSVSLSWIILKTKNPQTKCENVEDFYIVSLTEYCHIGHVRDSFHPCTQSNSRNMSHQASSLCDTVKMFFKWETSEQRSNKLVNKLLAWEPILLERGIKWALNRSKDITSFHNRNLKKDKLNIRTNMKQKQDKDLWLQYKQWTLETPLQILKNSDFSVLD